MQDANQILTADFIDILFDGRNKSYGAYELRRSYEKRMMIAMAAMIMACLLFATFAFMNKRDSRGQTMSDSNVVTLVDIPDQPAVKPPPPVPPPPPAEQPKLAAEKFVPIAIVPDELVSPDEMPPEVTELDHRKIGTEDVDGQLDDNTITKPPNETIALGASLPASAPAQEDEIFIKAELPAQFPGGPDAWKRYLERHLRYPESALENGTQGIVQVQFVVDKDGAISEVLALNDPGDGLAQEAARIILKGPKWTPAEQNNRKVKFRVVQAISFRLE
jgi:periplasmic protein TonB